MTTLRETVARAAYETYFAGLIGCCEDAWDDLPLEHQERLMRAQDAAIAAVREHLSEPSEAVIEAGGIALDGPDDRAADVWRAMLAVAFEDKA